MSIVEQIALKYVSLSPHMDERARRIWAATEARQLGYGGVSLVHRATGLARSVVHDGIKELSQSDVVPLNRVRRTGAGRKRTIQHDLDFPDPSAPRAFPYGIYDIGRDVGFVNVGSDHDTSAFAAASIRAL